MKLNVNTGTAKSQCDIVDIMLYKESGYLAQTPSGHGKSLRGGDGKPLVEHLMVLQSM